MLKGLLKKHIKFNFLQNLFFVLWNIAIIVFSTSVIFEYYIKDILIIDATYLIVGAIFLGVISFIFFVLFYFANAGTINPKFRLKDIFYVSIPCFLLVFSLISFNLTSGIREEKVKSLAPKKQVIQASKKEVSDTQPNTNNLNLVNPQPKIVENNPMITCRISDKCGGGTKYMRESDCENSTCCEVGDDWIFYLSKDDCDKDQKKYHDELLKKIQEASDYEYDYKSPTYNPPVYTQPPTYTPPVYTPPIYTPPQKTEEEIALEIRQCKSDVRKKYSQLLSRCNFGDSSATEMCIYALTKESEKELKACEQ